MCISFFLVSPDFLKEKTHLVVIDPCVGTSRRRITIKGKPCLYVGSDNGLLPSAAKAERIEKIVEISNYRFIITSTSQPSRGGKSLHLLKLTF